MFIRSAVPLAAGLLLVAAAAPVWAQPACAKRDQLVDQFQDKFAEKPTALGLVSEDAVLEVLTSDKGTWTIIITGADGASCPIASGIAWESLNARDGASNPTQAPGTAGSVLPKQLVGTEHGD